MTFSCASLGSLVIIFYLQKTIGFFTPIFSLFIGHLSCFKILQENPILTSKLVHEKIITDIE